MTMHDPLTVKAHSTQRIDWVAPPNSCVACSAREVTFCGKLTDSDRSWPLAKNTEAARARDVIYHANQPTEHIYVLCEGWAFRFHRLRDGRRHILSFLISGDFISLNGVFTGNSSFSIQALTDVRYCKFERAQVRSLLQQDPQVFDTWAATGASVQRETGRTSVALGRFLAHERIAWLILQLRDRLATRGVINSDAIEFPLRQSHIADATGLTTVHACRVINSFRKAGLFAIEDGILRIFDLAKLRRIVDVM